MATLWFEVVDITVVFIFIRNCTFSLRLTHGKHQRLLPSFVDLSLNLSFFETVFNVSHVAVLVNEASTKKLGGLPISGEQQKVPLYKIKGKKHSRVQNDLSHKRGALGSKQRKFREFEHLWLVSQAWL